jgi:hypothetical protein
MTEVYVRKPAFAVPIKGSEVGATEIGFTGSSMTGYRLMLIGEGDRVRLIPIW